MKKRFSQDTYSVHGDRLDIGANAELAKLTGHASNDILTPDKLELMRVSERNYFVKTHRRPDHYTSIDDKVIYIIRDGRDVISSYYNYLKNFSSNYVTIQNVILGQVPFGCWADHVAAWSALDSDRLLLLRYESYLDTPENFVRSIADFVGIDDSGEGIPEFGELKNVSKQFFRRGVAESWRDDLNAEALALFWLINGDAMEEQGYRKDSTQDFDSPAVRADLRAHIGDLYAGNKRFERRCTELRNEIDKTKGALSWTSQKLNEARKELHSTQIEARLLKSELQQLLGSTSWRITAGLRWATALCRGLLQGREDAPAKEAREA